MPKRGKSNNRVWTNDGDNRGPRDSRHDGGKYYYEHDQRADLTRRVSFKAGTSNRIGKQKRHQPQDWDHAIQSRLGSAEDDVDMSGAGFVPGNSGRRFNPYGRGGRGRGGRGQGRVNSPAPNAQFRKLIDVPTSWYRILIPHGHKHTQQFIISSLQRHISPVPLEPFYYRIQGTESSFYVDNFATAEALQAADRQITTEDGFKLLVRVRSGFPPVTVDDNYKTRMKLAMSKRYSTENKALNLERFHMDPTLKEDLVVALFRPTLMLTALDVIAENIPELVALNLGDNKLHSIDHLTALAKKLPNLTILHMPKNKIRDVRQLDALRDLKLVELNLEGNPLCSRLKSHSVYVSEVIKRFPRLRKLDGVELPPPILFDQPDEEETTIPPYNGSFLVNQDGRDFIRQFLEQYFRIFDDDNRQPLSDAYHDEATLSMACAYLAGKDNNYSNNRLDAYMPLSRNLLRINDPARRSKMLHQGKAAILSFLKELPRTHHDPLSFAVDMPIYTPQLIQINVSGILREREARNQPLRSFSRVFVIVPVGSGFCIINETIFITNPTDLQEKSAFKSVTAQPTQAAPAPGPSTSAPQVDASVRNQMVQALHQHTRMNITWATKCLEETNWNYDLAVVSFTELSKINAIPPEAFIV